MQNTLKLTRLIDAPIIAPARLAGETPRHENINGPSLIRVSDWIDSRLGVYYLYYADHKGSRIKLAYADALEGPWTNYAPGALHLHATPFLHEPPAIPAGIDIDTLGIARAPGVPSPLEDCTIPHIASPEVIIDEPSRTIRLYYHGLDAFLIQVTRVALSRNGLDFAPRSEILAPPYLRMFRYRDLWYGLAMPGSLWRSQDGISNFEAGPNLFEPNMRHAGLWLRDDILFVFWTRVGDAPERILLSTIRLDGDWMKWRESAPIDVLRPERTWEGANIQISASLRSSVDHPVNQLRDPAIFSEAQGTYLVYAVAGESGLAIARVCDADT